MSTDNFYLNFVLISKNMAHMSVNILLSGTSAVLKSETNCYWKKSLSILKKLNNLPGFDGKLDF